VVNAAAGRLGAPRPAMNIGEVLARLRPEFPDVTISKIRFLEEQGLVTPERTAAGYRKFDHHDLERLRYVLTV
jgi:DNA-binding transcriptional MerR regulator